MKRQPAKKRQGFSLQQAHAHFESTHSSAGFGIGSKSGKQAHAIAVGSGLQHLSMTGSRYQLVSKVDAPTLKRSGSGSALNSTTNSGISSSGGAGASDPFDISRNISNATYLATVSSIAASQPLNSSLTVASLWPDRVPLDEPSRLSIRQNKALAKHLSVRNTQNRKIAPVRAGDQPQPLGAYRRPHSAPTGEQQQLSLFPTSAAAADALARRASLASGDADQSDSDSGSDTAAATGRTASQQQRPNSSAGLMRRGSSTSVGHAAAAAAAASAAVPVAPTPAASGWRRNVSGFGSGAVTPNHRSAKFDARSPAHHHTHNRTAPHLSHRHSSAANAGTPNHHRQQQQQQQLSTSQSSQASFHRRGSTGGGGGGAAVHLKPTVLPVKGFKFVNPQRSTVTSNVSFHNTMPVAARTVTADDDSDDGFNSHDANRKAKGGGTGSPHTPDSKSAAFEFEVANAERAATAKIDASTNPDSHFVYASVYVHDGTSAKRNATTGNSGEGGSLSARDEPAPAAASAPDAEDDGTESYFFGSNSQPKGVRNMFRLLEKTERQMHKYLPPRTRAPAPAPVVRARSSSVVAASASVPNLLRRPSTSGGVGINDSSYYTRSPARTPQNGRSRATSPTHATVIAHALSAATAGSTLHVPANLALPAQPSGSASPSAETARALIRAKSLESVSLLRPLHSEEDGDGGAGGGDSTQRAPAPHSTIGAAFSAAVARPAAGGAPQEIVIRHATDFSVGYAPDTPLNSKPFSPVNQPTANAVTSPKGVVNTRGGPNAFRFPLAPPPQQPQPSTVASSAPSANLQPVANSGGGTARTLVTTPIASAGPVLLSRTDSLPTNPLTAKQEAKLLASWRAEIASTPPARALPERNIPPPPPPAPAPTSNGAFRIELSTAATPTTATGSAAESHTGLTSGLTLVVPTVNSSDLLSPQSSGGLTPAPVAVDRPTFLGVESVAPSSPIELDTPTQVRTHMMNPSGDGLQVAFARPSYAVSPASFAYHFDRSKVAVIAAVAPQLHTIGAHPQLHAAGMSLNTAPSPTGGFFGTPLPPSLLPAPAAPPFQLKPSTALHVPGHPPQVAHATSHSQPPAPVGLSILTSEDGLSMHVPSGGGGDETPDDEDVPSVFERELAKIQTEFAGIRRDREQAEEQERIEAAEIKSGKSSHSAHSSPAPFNPATLQSRRSSTVEASVPASNSGSSMMSPLIVSPPSALQLGNKSNFDTGSAVHSARNPADGTLTPSSAIVRDSEKQLRVKESDFWTDEQKLNHKMRELSRREREQSKIARAAARANERRRLKLLEEEARREGINVMVVTDTHRRMDQAANDKQLRSAARRASLVAANASRVVEEGDEDMKSEDDATNDAAAAAADESSDSETDLIEFAENHTRIVTSDGRTASQVTADALRQPTNPQWLTSRKDYTELKKSQSMIENVRILHKTSDSRSSEELNRVLKWLSHVRFITQFPRDIQIELCRVMEVVSIPRAGPTIYERGAMGDRMFLLHSGRVSIESQRWPLSAARALDDDEQRDMSAEAGGQQTVLHAGSHFGERLNLDREREQRQRLLTLSKARRLWRKFLDKFLRQSTAHTNAASAATASSTTHTRIHLVDVVAEAERRTRYETTRVISQSGAVLCSIKFHDLDSIKRSYQERQLRYTVAAFQKVEFLRHWSIPRLRHLALLVDTRSYVRGETIARQSDRANSICVLRDTGSEVQLIKSSQFVSYRRWPQPNNKWEVVQTVNTHSFPVFTLKQFEFFGEEGVLGATARDYTAKCASKTLTVLVLNRALFIHLFQEQTLELIRKRVESMRKYTLTAIQKKSRPHQPDQHDVRRLRFSAAAVDRVASRPGTAMATVNREIARASTLGSRPSTATTVTSAAPARLQASASMSDVLSRPPTAPAATNRPTTATAGTARTPQAASARASRRTDDVATPLTATLTSASATHALSSLQLSSMISVRPDTFRRPQTPSTATADAAQLATAASAAAPVDAYRPSTAPPAMMHASRSTPALQSRTGTRPGTAMAGGGNTHSPRVDDSHPSYTVIPHDDDGGDEDEMKAADDSGGVDFNTTAGSNQILFHNTETGAAARPLSASASAVSMQQRAYQHTSSSVRRYTPKAVRRVSDFRSSRPAPNSVATLARSTPAPTGRTGSLYGAVHIRHPAELLNPAIVVTSNILDRSIPFIEPNSRPATAPSAGDETAPRIWTTLDRVPQTGSHKRSALFSSSSYTLTPQVLSSTAPVTTAAGSRPATGASDGRAPPPFLRSATMRVEAESSLRFSSVAAIARSQPIAESTPASSNGARPNTAPSVGRSGDGAGFGTPSAAGSSVSGTPPARVVSFVDTTPPVAGDEPKSATAKSTSTTTQKQHKPIIMESARKASPTAHRTASARTTTSIRVPVKSTVSRISTLNHTNANGLATGTTIEVGFAPIRHAADLNHLHTSSAAPALSSAQENIFS